MLDRCIAFSSRIVILLLMKHFRDLFLMVHFRDLFLLLASEGLPFGADISSYFFSRIFAYFLNVCFFWNDGLR